MRTNLKTLMGTLLLAGTVFAGAPAAFSQVSIGIVVGAPPRPRVIAVRPPCPEPENEYQYAWIDGYWYPVEGHYYWHRGYWTRPPYVGAVWVVPRYDDGRYYGGYWQGPNGRFEHDHHWDRDRDRDWGRRHEHEDNGRHEGWHKDKDRHKDKHRHKDKDKDRDDRD